MTLAPFAAPQPLAAPQPSLLAYPGLTSSERAVDAVMPPGFLPAPTKIVGTDFFAQQQVGSYNALNGVLGGALESDPRSWTPDEAAAQTDRALARIGQANPEMARALAAQRGQAAAQGENLPWWKDILHGVGEVMKVTHIDDVMEVLGRPLKAVEEVIHDWGKESVWTNMADGLSGHSDVSFSDILVDNFGMERGKLTAVLGLVGDIALDPLTWATFGAGGIGRAAAGKATSVAAIKSAAEKGSVEVSSMLADLTSVLGREATVDDLAHTLMSTGAVAKAASEKASSGLIGRLKTAMGMVHEDAAPGLLDWTVRQADTEAYRQLTRIADDAYTLSTTAGWSRVSQKAIDKLSAEHGYALDKGAVNELLKEQVSAGTGFLFGPEGKALYRQGKEAAAALGGWRFRGSLSLPGVGGFRFAGARVPLLPARMDFSMGRRFFAGLSGQQRLLRMVADGSATVAHLERFWDRTPSVGGFSGLRKFDPEVADKLAKGSLHGGSIFYPMSEMVGGFTAKLSGHAAQLRGGGLGAKFAGEINAQGPHITKSLENEIGSVELPVELGVPTRKGALLRLEPKQAEEELAKVSAEMQKRGVDDIALAEDIDRLLPGDPQLGADEYWGARRAAEVAKGDAADPAELAFIDAKRVEAKELEARLKAEGVERWAYIHRALGHQRDTVEGRVGVLAHSTDTPIEDVDIIHPDDAAALDANLPENLRDLEWEAEFDGPVSNVEAFSDGAPDTQTPIRGVALRAKSKARAAERPPLPDMDPADVDAAVREMTGGGGMFGDIVPMNDPVAEELKALVGAKVGAGGVDTIEGTTTSADVLAAIERGASRSGEDFGEAVNRFLGHVNADRRFRGLPEIEGGVRPRYQVAPKSVYQVDLSPRAGGAAREATSTINKLDEAVAGYREFLERAKQGDVPTETGEALDADVVEEMQRIIEKEGTFDEQLAPVISQWLRSEGHDAVSFKLADGEYRMVLLAPRQGSTAVSAARVTAQAPRLGSGVGHAQRALSQVAMDAIGDVPQADKIVNRLLRGAGKMNREQAERYIQEQLKKLGHGLLDGQKALEDDLLRMHRRLTGRATRQATARYLGEAFQELEGMGLARGAFKSGPVGIGRYKYVVSQEGQRALESLSGDVQSAADRAANFSNQYDLPALVKRAADTNEAVGLRDAQYRAARAEAAAQRAVANTIMARLRGEESELGTRVELFSEADVAKGVAARQKFYDAIPADELTDLGKGIFLHEKGLNKRYFAVQDGKVLGFVEAKAWDPAHVPGKNDWDRVATAQVLPEARKSAGGNVARDLMNAMFDDLGLTGNAEALSRFDAANQFSHGGAKLTAETIRGEAKRLRDRAYRQAKRSQEKYAAAQAELDAARIEHAGAVAESERVLTRMRQERAPILPALVPIEDAKNMTGMTHVNFPGFFGQAMPAYMAEEFKGALSKYKQLNDVHKQFRRFNAWWKTWATWMFPGFHIRNIMGAYFNNWLGGVAFHDYVTMSRIRRAERELYHHGAAGLKGVGSKGRWATTKVITKDADLVHALERGGTFRINGVPVRDMTYADLAHEASALNITSSNGRAFAEARLTVDEVEGRAGVQGRPGKMFVEKIPVVKKLPEGLKGMGTMTENTFRQAAWVRGLRDSGNVMEARAFTMMRHGDYEDLNDWEYGMVRDLIPFYKWMRTNTPYQIHQLFEAPGKLLGVAKAQRAAFELRGRDYDKDRYRMPDWMQEGFVVPWAQEDPEGAFQAITLDLPMADLFFSGRDFFSTFLPQVRPLLENYVYEQNTFTGQELKGAPVKLTGPTQTLLAPISPVLKAMGVIRQGPNGEDFISDKTQNLLGIIPTFSRFRNWIYADPERVKLRGNTFASAIFGVGLRAVDEEQMAATELDFYYSQVLPQMEHLKQMGYTLPTTADINDVLGTTDQVLSSLGIISSADKFKAA